MRHSQPKPDRDFSNLLDGGGLPEESFCFIQNYASKNPVEPKALLAIAGFEPVFKLAFDDLTPLREFEAGLALMSQLEIAHGQDDFGGGCPRLVLRGIREASAAPICGLRIVAPAIVDQRQ